MPGYLPCNWFGRVDDVIYVSNMRIFPACSLLLGTAALGGQPTDTKALQQPKCCVSVLMRTIPKHAVYSLAVVLLQYLPQGRASQSLPFPSRKAVGIPECHPAPCAGLLLPNKKGTTAFDRYPLIRWIPCNWNAAALPACLLGARNPWVGCTPRLQV
jgi:hypothetical protein